MKKKILIITSSLSTGGIERCLINICDALDYEKYDVDLYLFNEGRSLLDKLNKNVRLLPDSPYYGDVYNLPIAKSLKSLIRKREFSLAIYRLLRFFRIRLGFNKFTERDFKNMSRAMLRIDSHYDVAIGFEEGTACYYVAECVSADVKLGWVHTDIKKIDSNRALDRRAFGALDSVITVSENSLASLKDEYPELSDKFKCISVPRLMNEEAIDSLAREESVMEREFTNILSVGRLVELKGFHLCVPVCRQLRDEGYNVRWYIAGEGDYRSEIEELVRKYKLEDSFILLGNCDNPYKHMRAADICVQPSSYEGYSVAVFEEKHFFKAVVVSNINSNLEMIDDGVNGVVVERSSEDIYRGVKLLLDDPQLRERLASAPAKGYARNKEIISAIEKEFEKKDR